MSAAVTVWVAALALLLGPAAAHVSLTFPPARNYPLDFLDSARTRGPCGMPKGKLLFHCQIILMLTKHRVVELYLYT